MLEWQGYNEAGKDRIVVETETQASTSKICSLFEGSNAFSFSKLLEEIDSELEHGGDIVKERVF